MKEMEWLGQIAGAIGGRWCRELSRCPVDPMYFLVFALNKNIDSRPGSRRPEPQKDIGNRRFRIGQTTTSTISRGSSQLSSSLSSPRYYRYTNQLENRLRCLTCLLFADDSASLY